MINAFRAEWVRLLRPRTLLAVGLPLSLFPALLTVLSFAVATRDAGTGPGRHLSVTVDDLTTSDGFLVGMAPAATLLGMVVMVLFAVTFGADATHGTLRNLLVREPRRTHLLTGRLLALLVLTAAGLVLSVATATATAWLAAGRYDVGTAAWSGFVAETAATWAALVTAAVGWGATGAVLGTVLRPTTTAVAVGVVWVLLVESILAEVSDTLGRWLPGVVFSATAAPGTGQLSSTAAALALGAYATLGCLAAATWLTSRDVLV